MPSEIGTIRYSYSDKFHQVCLPRWCPSGMANQMDSIMYWQPDGDY